MLCRALPTPTPRCFSRSPAAGPRGDDRSASLTLGTGRVVAGPPHLSSRAAAAAAAARIVRGDLSGVASAAADAGSQLGALVDASPPGCGSVVWTSSEGGLPLELLLHGPVLKELSVVECVLRMTKSEADVNPNAKALQTAVRQTAVLQTVTVFVASMRASARTTPRTRGRAPARLVCAGRVDWTTRRSDASSDRRVVRPTRRVGRGPGPRLRDAASARGDGPRRRRYSRESRADVVARLEGAESGDFASALGRCLQKSSQASFFQLATLARGARTCLTVVLDLATPYEEIRCAVELRIRYVGSGLSGAHKDDAVFYDKVSMESARTEPTGNIVSALLDSQSKGNFQSQCLKEDLRIHPNKLEVRVGGLAWARQSSFQPFLAPGVAPGPDGVAFLVTVDLDHRQIIGGP